MKNYKIFNKKIPLALLSLSASALLIGSQKNDQVSAASNLNKATKTEIVTSANNNLQQVINNYSGSYSKTSQKSSQNLKKSRNKKLRKTNKYFKNKMSYSQLRNAANNRKKARNLIAKASGTNKKEAAKETQNIFANPDLKPLRSDLKSTKDVKNKNSQRKLTNDLNNINKISQTNYTIRQKAFPKLQTTINNMSLPNSQKMQLKTFINYLNKRVPERQLSQIFSSNNKIVSYYSKVNKISKFSAKTQLNILLKNQNFNKLFKDLAKAPILNQQNGMQLLSDINNL